MQPPWTTNPFITFKAKGTHPCKSPSGFYVEDYYQSYIDRETQMPLKFIRKINEGGYTKDIQIDFNRAENTARIWNRENDVKVTAEIFSLIKIWSQPFIVCAII